jgi:uncharacterized protein (DUF362 family)/Pyruvate/2-oxoacid:ferredoxin oxidoreductase delta subunit
MKQQVSVVKCANYNQEALSAKVREAVELIGGLQHHVKPGSKVLLKPNLLMAIEPERAITTHPGFVRAVIKILKEIDCKIYLGDGPSVFTGDIEDIVNVYERTGIKKIAEEEKIELVAFTKGFMQGYFPLTSWVKECDCIINLPKLKTHSFMVITGAVKNLFGLIPGRFKLECHKNFYQPEKFARMLLDIYEIAKPALNIVDGIQGIEGEGPATSGTKRDFGFVMASADAVAIDVTLAKLMSLPAASIFTNREAARREIISADLENIEFKGEDSSSCVISDIKLPNVSLRQILIYKLPDSLANVLKRMITFHPKIDSDVCRLCEACIKNCPQKAMSEKGGKIVIDYSQCISCFCCQEICPYAAIVTKKSLLAKMMGM